MGTLLSMGDSEKALEIYSDKDGGEEIILKRANCLYSLGREEEAKEEYRKLTEKNKEYVPGLYNYGYLLYNKGKYKEALELFRKCINIVENRGDNSPILKEKIYYAIGLCLFNESHFEESQKSFEKCLEIIKDKNFTVLNNIGRCLYSRGEYLKSIEYFEQAFKDSDEYMYICLYNKANSLYKLNSKYEAYTIYNTIINKYDQNFFPCYYSLGLYFKEIGDLDQAITNLRKSLSIHPGNLSCLLELGISLKEKGRISEALDVFSDIVNIDSNYGNGEAEEGRASCFKELGQFSRSISSYNKAMHIYSMHNLNIKKAYSLYELSLIYKSSNNINKSLEYIEESIKNHQDWKFYYVQGILYMLNKAYTIALESFNNSMGLNDSKFSGIFFNKAKILYEERNYNDSLHNINEAIKNYNIYNEPNMLKLDYFDLSNLYYYKGMIYKKSKDILINSISEPESNLEEIKQNYSLYNISISPNYIYALKYFDEAIFSNPKKAEYYFAKASLFFDLEMYQKSFEYLNKAISINPSYSEAYFKTGECHYYLKDYQKSIQFYDKAINLNNKKSIYHYHKGLSLFELRRKNEAMYCFEKSLGLKYKIVKSLYYKSRCLYDLEIYKETYICLKKLLELIRKKSKVKDIENNDIWEFYDKCHNSWFTKDLQNILSETFIYLGGITSDISIPLEEKDNESQNKLQRNKKAIYYYDLSLKFCENCSAYYNKATCLITLNRLSEALENLKKSFGLNPTSSECKFSEGKIYYTLGKYDSAMISFGTAFELDQGNYNAINNKGKCLFRMKRYQEALDCYDIAEKINKYFDVILFNKARVYYELKEYKKSEGYFKRSFRLDSSDYVSLYYLSMCKKNLGDEKNYENNIDKCLSMKNTYAPALIEKGKILMNKKELNDALSCFKKAVENNPENEEGKKMLIECNERMYADI